MQITSRRDADSMELVLSGRLTFADAGQFAQVVDQATKGVKGCVLDLGKLEFIDSTGMSLLVHIYDAGQANGIRVAIRNATGMVADTLRRASFDTLFDFR